MTTEPLYDPGFAIVAAMIVGVVFGYLVGVVSERDRPKN